MLGGGGFTGGVYEIGALRALDLLSVNRTVNQFDIYVGTSAGSLIAALAANGVTPEQMMRIVNDQVPHAVPRHRPRHAAAPELPRVRRQGRCKLPLHLLGVARERRPQPRLALAPSTSRIALADALPSGLYTGAGIEEYVAHGALRPRPHRRLPRCCQHELYLAATDLDTCERIVLGAEGWDDVPISTAVRASTALPMVYRPTGSSDRELVDGGIVSTTNLDIAVEAGAKFIVVVNPLVPYVNDFSKEIPTLFGTRVRRVSDMGFPKIGYQTFKLLAYQRLHEMARHWKERYPGVDIVLIEPDPDDELMFQTNILNYSSRRRRRPPRLRVGHGQAGQGLRRAARGLPRATASRSPPRACARSSATSRPSRREDARLAADPRADDRHAAAPVALAALPRRARRTAPAYFSLTTLRLTFSVGVSSPVSCERSWSRIDELLDLLDLRVVLVDPVEIALDQLVHLRLAAASAAGSSGSPCSRAKCDDLLRVERDQRDRDTGGGRRA